MRPDGKKVADLIARGFGGEGCVAYPADVLLPPNGRRRISISVPSNFKTLALEISGGPSIAERILIVGMKVAEKAVEVDWLSAGDDWIGFRSAVVGYVTP